MTRAIRGAILLMACALSLAACLAPGTGADPNLWRTPGMNGSGEGGNGGGMGM